MNLFIDVETIGTSDPVIIAEIAAEIGPPGNYSKADTIAAWEQEKKPALVAEAVQKTAFDGGTGSIVCVGYAFDKGPATSITHGSEVVLLHDLEKATATMGHGVYVIGHNVSWDVRFLWQRFVVNKVTVPTWLKAAARAKPWDIGDTMTLWNPERDKKITLDRLCGILGIPSPKSEMDGSKVWEAYRAGKIEEIAAYCRGDVEATRACYQRMTT